MLNQKDCSSNGCTNLLSLTESFSDQLALSCDLHYIRTTAGFEGKHSSRLTFSSQKKVSSLSIEMSASADGRLHRYWPERNLVLFEYLPTGESTRSSSVAANTLIFIGGLYDSFLSVPYVPVLASSIHQYGDWSLMEIQLSSSGLGWGTGDLNRDIEEIGKGVEYVHERVKTKHMDPATISHGGKIVLMGHSTGSQDVLHYLSHKPEQERPSIDGAILQAAVSDREGLAMLRGGDKIAQHAYEECIRISLNSKLATSQSWSHVLPPELTKRLGWPRIHVSCERFLSLTSPFSPIRPENDDLFSSDLSDETLSRTFGSVGSSGLLKSSYAGRPLMLILLSAEDEYTPKTVNKKTLIDRWRLALEDGHAGMVSGSGVIAGASHNVKEHPAQCDLINRVLDYLNIIGRGVPRTTSPSS